MKILVVNDDGIMAEGIRRLAAAAAQLGEVWVAAPKSQCSAMSHRLTVFGDLAVEPVSFPVEGIKGAYSIDGTPADCVKIGLRYLMPEKPDAVFSGINRGYNTGVDILYSGTVGAAMEALANGIPAIAFSLEMNEVYDTADRWLLPIAKELLARPAAPNEMWNVNFPGCPLQELKGVLYNRTPAQHQFYLDRYHRTERENGAFVLKPMGYPTREAEEGTDIRAVLDRYISVGTVRNAVLTDKKYQ